MVKSKKYKYVDIVDAVQWFKIGDHPDVSKYDINSEYGYLHKSDEYNKCVYCGNSIEDHGLWLNVFEDPYIVCPGDYIVSSPDMEDKLYRKDIFEIEYNPVSIIDKLNSLLG